MNKYDITFIIPVYNTEKYIDACMKSILNQKFDLNRIQIIMINDGSRDNSLEVMKKYESDNIIVIDKENTGVSDTRNIGLRMAQGKYILFLDSDDFISNDTCKLVYETFEQHQNEFDVIVYPIYQYNNKTKKEKLIKRFKNYEGSGIYDLNEYYYLFNPTINIAIVNKYENNILFNTNLFFHEDEQYSVKLLKDRHKIFYLDKPKYFYRIHPSSTSSLKSKPYFSYEQYMKLYEYFIKNYVVDGKLIKFIQYCIFNDIKWRINSKSFYPEYLDDRHYKKELKRIKKIFKYIDEDLIIHDNTNIYQIIYLLQNFKNKKLRLELSDGTYKLFYNNKLIFLNNNIETYIYKYNLTDTKLNISCSFKIPFFNLVDYEIYEKLEYKDKIVENKLDTFLINSKNDERYTKNIRENYFEKEYDINNLKGISYYVKVKDTTLPTSFSFSPRVAFNKGLRRYVIKDHDKVYGILVNKNLNERKYIGGNYTENDSNIKSIKSDQLFFRKFNIKKDLKPILSQHKKMFRKNYREYLLRITNKPNKNVYLYIDYYDYLGSSYEQFIYDKERKDDIKRYYITENKTIINNKDIINISSKKYKKLYLKATKLIISNHLLSNYTFNFKNENIFTDKFPKEIILINENDLKFKKYQKLIKKDNNLNHIFVFNEKEKESLINNYSYKDKDITVTGNIINKTKNLNKKKILLYINYRKYILTSDSFKVDKDFLKDNLYYEKIKELFTCSKLIKLLEKNDLYIDVKISDCISNTYDLFKDFSNNRINLVDKIDLSTYALLISDISNIDQKYLPYKRPIMYYIFDKNLLNSNLDYLNDLTIDDKLVYGSISYDLKDLEKNLKEVIKDKFKIKRKDKYKYKLQCINIDDYHEKIYNTITRDVK